MVTGESPKEEIDHANLIKTDNRWVNLREASHSQNMINRRDVFQNNTSGFKGVCFDKKSGKWRAYITKNGKQIALGRFSTREEAGLARKSAEQKLYRDFARESLQGDQE